MSNKRRLNNLSARLIANNWLVNNGMPAIDADKSYEQFAYELRKATAKTVVQQTFASRSDAVAYIRAFARKVIADGTTKSLFADAT